MSKPEPNIVDHARKYRRKIGIFQGVPSKRANSAFHLVAIIEAGAAPNPSEDADYLRNPIKQAIACDCEKQIDQPVYKLYGLTPEEIKVVEREN